VLNGSKVLVVVAAETDGPGIGDSECFGRKSAGLHRRPHRRVLPCILTLGRVMPVCRKKATAGLGGKIACPTLGIPSELYPYGETELYPYR
jgi:hypothetical protein